MCHIDRIIFGGKFSGKFSELILGQLPAVKAVHGIICCRGVRRKNRSMFICEILCCPFFHKFGKSITKAYHGFIETRKIPSVAIAKYYNLAF